MTRQDMIEMDNQRGLENRVAEAIDAGVRGIMAEHPHETRCLLYAFATILMGYGAYKEFRLISA